MSLRLAAQVPALRALEGGALLRAPRVEGHAHAAPESAAEDRFDARRSKLLDLNPNVAARRVAAPRVAPADTTPRTLVEYMSGRSIDELAEIQLDWMRARAAARGQSQGELVRTEVSTHGYGGSTATWWTGLSATERTAWQARFTRAVESVREVAPPEILAVIEGAEAAGGGFAFSPQRVEELSAYAYHTRRTLHVGKSWVEDALDDPRKVIANIAHELGGHGEFGTTAGKLIMDGVLAQMNEEDRATATSGGNSVFSAYGYLETEIYAELRELPYRVEGSGGDAPERDVPKQLKRIREAFAPEVARALVGALLYRARVDPSITAEAFQLLRTSVRKVFDEPTPARVSA